MPLRRALLLVIAGLSIQLAGAFYWTPGTFVLTASFGAPLVLLGVALGALAAARAPVSESKDPSRDEEEAP